MKVETINGFYVYIILPNQASTLSPFPRTILTTSKRYIQKNNFLFPTSLFSKTTLLQRGEGALLKFNLEN